MRIDGRPIGSEFRNRAGARARHDQMSRRNARRQIGEERRHLGGDAETVIDSADARQILLARLLGEQEARAHGRIELLDRRRHDVRHDLAPWLPPKTRRRRRPSAIGATNCCAAAASTAGRNGLPVDVALAASVGSASRTPAKLVAIALTRGANSRLARPMTAFCSWMMVGIFRTLAATSGGTVG